VRRRRILLLINASAGAKRPIPWSRRHPDPAALADALRGHGLDVQLHVLREADDIAAMVHEAVGAGSDVVVGGGDGTVRAAAGVLSGRSEATLGILPLGTFNNIARGIGIPDDLDEALGVIARGADGAIDVGWAHRDDRADGRHFLEAAGVGLDAVAFLAAAVAGRRGLWRAARAAWHGLARRRTARLVLTLDGVPHRIRAPAVTVSNVPYHGMGFAIAPDADPTDGRLTLTVFARMSSAEVIARFIATAAGIAGREPRARTLQARRVTVVSGGAALPVHADGESLGVTPISFEIRPGALRVFR
jgi:diacylglycerol kinase (ATP)